MMHGLGQRAAHDAERARHRVEPRVVHHVDDGGDAAAFLADHLRESVVVFDLGRGVRLVAELVLQPHDVEGVAFAIRLDARHEEAAKPAIRIGERQEGVAHGRGAEPFVAHEPVLRPGPPSPKGKARVVFARTSEPPCFSVIAMPTVTPRFSAMGRRGAS